MQEARACILRLGGIPQMNTYAKLYLALLGQFPWKYLPTVPAEMIFFPQWFVFHIYELSSWSRAMLMPLAVSITSNRRANSRLNFIFTSSIRSAPSKTTWAWPGASRA
jgi:squalene cyclase